MILIFLEGKRKKGETEYAYKIVFISTEILYKINFFTLPEAQLRLITISYFSIYMTDR